MDPTPSVTATTAAGTAAIFSLTNDAVLLGVVGLFLSLAIPAALNLWLGFVNRSAVKLTIEGQLQLAERSAKLNLNTERELRRDQALRAWRVDQAKPLF